MLTSRNRALLVSREWSTQLKHDRAFLGVAAVSHFGAKRRSVHGLHKLPLHALTKLNHD